MYLKVDDFMCLRGRVSLPLTGLWTADVSIDPGTSDSTLPDFGGLVGISLGEAGYSLKGTVRRVNNAFDVVYARIVGGMGDLRKVLPPKAYQGATFGLILSDVLSQAGAQVSATVSSGLINLNVPFWTVLRGPAWLSLSRLVSEATILTGTQQNWRVLPDGTIFVGQETWPDATMASFDQMSWTPNQLSTVIYAPDPSVRPGQTWQSAHVSAVEHIVNPDLIRTTVWFQDQAPS